MYEFVRVKLSGLHYTLSLLILQGLRTLELCVDNLQPDFLYDHIQPVRAELMQVSAPKVGLFLATLFDYG